MSKKRFFSLIMAFVMMMSLCLQVSAMEVSTADTSSATEIQPRDVVVLYELNGVSVGNGYPVTFTLTPKKGSNLKFIGEVTGTMSGVKIEVTKNGGWWPSKTVTVMPGSDQNRYDLINNCNGEPYTVKLVFTGSFSPVLIYGSFTQTEYV